MKKIVVLLLALATILPIASCKKDNTETSDYATAVSGVYTGKLLYGTETVKDAYVVTLSRISSTVVSMSADFLDGDVTNFNVTKSGNTYSLSSESVYNITTTVSGKQLNISYLTTGGYMFSFSGTKD